MSNPSGSGTVCGTDVVLQVGEVTCLWCHILKLEQNVCHLSDGIFKWSFLNENIWFSNKISLKYAPQGQIDHESTLVQVMAWYLTGDRPLHEPMLTLDITSSPSDAETGIF